MTDNAHIDRVAEAIWRATLPEDHPGYLAWDDAPAPLRNDYRLMAQAAIDALNPVIDTVEQLDALPVGAVVIDDMLDVLSRDNADGGWLMAGYEGLHIPVLPARLLWSPSWRVDGKGNQ